jgi:hypothetical protein
VATLYNNSIVTDGLVLCLDAANSRSYPRSGTAWNDLTQNGINFLLVNGPSFQSSNNGVLFFDGTNDHATINYSGIFNGATFSIWTKTSNTSNYMFIAVKGGLTGTPNLSNGITIFTPDWASSTVQIYLNDATGVSKSMINATFNKTIRDNIWHNIAVTYNYSGTTSTLVSYLDGIPQTTATLNEDRTNFFNYTQAYWVGGRSDIGGYFSGNIAYHTIHNKALSTQEIQQNFNAIRGRFGI